MVDDKSFYNRSIKALKLYQELKAPEPKSQVINELVPLLITEISQDIIDSITPNHPLQMPYIILSLRTVLQTMEQLFPEAVPIADELGKGLQTIALVAIKKKV